MNIKNIVILKFLYLRLSTNYMGYSFPYHSPMVPLFNKAIDRIIDSGIVDQLFEKHSPYRSMKHQVRNILTGDVFY